jgi:hypothetical protein
MKLLPCLIAIASVVHSAEAPAKKAPAELAVAIRYLKAEGVSHSHVYLYREDGKLLRQLTKDDSGQDRDPFFSPDGQTIVFTREVKETREFWSVEPLGKNLRKLDTVPEWYAKAPNAPHFRYPDFEEEKEGVVKPEPKFTSPDGATELILRTVKGDEEDEYNGPGHGKHFLLRDVKSGTQWEMGKLPGFVGLVDLLELSSDPKVRFFMHPPQRIAFFGLHLNSTDGDTVFAVDLNARRIVNLSPNWAAAFPLPGEPAFLTFASVRYVPIPNSKKTANCSYLERWDAELKKVRYAAERSAAILYGASMYRPGREPATIHIRKDPTEVK